MVDAVGDPYTVFYNQEEYQEFQDDGQGNYVGIGVMVGIKEDKIVVITPFEGSPAYEAGIRAGDFILKVEGVEYKGLGNGQSSICDQRGRRETCHPNHFTKWD